MKTTIIIPARYNSKRFPGKPLVHLKLPNGTSKPLIQLSWEAACRTHGINNIFIATDNLEIKLTAEGFGADVIMTSPDSDNGTSRCAEAIKIRGITDELIINFQGDAPLTPGRFIESLITEMKSDSSIKMSTPILRCNLEHYKRLIDDRRSSRVGATTSVFDNNYNALYFSKEVIPFLNAEKLNNIDLIPVYHHVGVYAYKNEILSQYINWPQGELEKLEGLEQLRFLENNTKVRCVLMNGNDSLFWELNNPTDIAIIEEILRKWDVT